MVWTRFEPFNVCCIAVPSRIPPRRFHALYDKVARSDVMWRAWVDVATNQGAPGVDGVTHRVDRRRGVAGCEVFLDGLAAQLRDRRRIGRSRCGGCISPSRASRARPGRSAFPRCADRVVMTAAKIVLEPIFEADFSPVVSGSARSAPPIRPSKRSGWRPTGERIGCSTPTSRRASTRSTTTPSWLRSSAGSSTGRC